MKKLIIVAITVLILILNGCSTEQTNPPKIVQKDQVEPNPPEVVTPEVITPEVVEPVKTPPPSEPEPIAQNYHMTPNYFIKPNNEQDNKKVVLLTFDDGPKDEQMLTSLLDTLDKHKAKAIFFVNGYRVKQKPELLKLIHERDQIIGNHSWDHINLKKETREKINQQIGDVQTIVKDLIGEPPLFFRPPNGAGNDDVHAKVKEEGMLYMTWSNGSLDWADNIKNPQGVIDSVMDQLLPGSNILMHELAWTVEALDELLTKIEEQGYSFIDPRAIELEARL
ncbi:MAG: polysaccharide deacetylase family protein [Paenibacillaceae bacterium]